MMAMTAITFVACGNKTTGNNDNGDADSVFMLDGPGSVYEPTKEEVGQYAVETVQEVYEAVSKAYTSEDWKTATSKLDEEFCSKDWNATVKAVIAKDKTNNDIPYFEADYWIMGQDWSEDIHATDFKLKNINLDEKPWHATVTLNLHNFNIIPVEVGLVYEDSAWKVDELNDWKEGMKDYLTSE